MSDTGNPKSLANGGVAVIATGVVLALLIDTTLSSQTNLNSFVWDGWLLVPLLPFATGCTMIGATVSLWAGGFLRPRWQIWIGDPPSTTLRANWKLWRTAGHLAIGFFAAIFLPVFPFALELTSRPEGFVMAYLSMWALFLPFVITGLCGLGLADWLMFMRPLAIFRSTHRRGQFHAALYCAIYLLILFDIMILLPRSIVSLSGPVMPMPDLAVVGISLLLLPWSAIKWIMGRRVFR